MFHVLLLPLLLTQTPPAPAATLPAPPPPPLCPPCPTCPAAPAPSPWTATIGVGLISLTGNSRSVTVTGNAVATHTTEHWIFGLKANGTYGDGRATDGTSSVLALQGALELRGDRRFTDRVSGYLLGGISADHVKSVEYSAEGELGAGYIWVNRAPGENELFFRTDLGMRYQRDSRFQYYPVPLDIPDVYMVAPRLGLELRAGDMKGVHFLQTAEVLPNLAGQARTTFNSLTKLSVHLVSKLSLGVAFTVAFDSAPAEGKVPTDTSLALQLDYSI